ncbi:hypothetical protein V3C99_003256 [Haemonchus contortus]|uniref:Uncharacterized protein n=1 Tax=Haemonchus contortus TaxID=6289 RepID=A0A7I5E6N4_HAECO|nr:unnamed protein product [Haemonchus contortus]
MEGSNQEDCIAAAVQNEAVSNWVERSVNRTLLSFVFAIPMEGSTRIANVPVASPSPGMVRSLCAPLAQTPQQKLQGSSTRLANLQNY